MPKKLDECVKKVKARGKSEKQAWAICQDTLFGKKFNDRIKFNQDTKTAISIRDGVQEYYGIELGLEPAYKTFKIYRHPETIKAVAEKLNTLAVTNDHVDLDKTPDNLVSQIIETEEIAFEDKGKDTTLLIKNKIKSNDKLLDLLKNGKKELSLGYKAELIPCEKYDFEQIDIEPHHLAIVDSGRCGSICTFTDKKTTWSEFKTMKNFYDENGEIDISKVASLAKELLPILQKVVAGTEKETNGEPEPKDEDEKDIEDGEKETKVEPTAEKKEEAVKKDIKDSKEFKDAIKKQTATFAKVIAKAKDFLDSSYDFTSKTTNEIMRDTLKTQYSDSFEDSELNTAFKMLKKDESYKQFGDAIYKPADLMSLKDKEI